MPRRWASVRGNGKSLSSKPRTGEHNAQNGFDFAFQPSGRILPENHICAKGTTHVHMGSDESGQARPRTAFSNHLTQSSGDSPDHPSRSQATSPSQPLVNSMLDSTGIVSHNDHKPLFVHTSIRSPPNHTRGSDTGHSPHKRRWRKFSDVFRSGSDTSRDISEHQPTDIVVKETRHQSPLTRTPWRGSTSPLPIQDNTTSKQNEPPTIDTILITGDGPPSQDVEITERPLTSYRNDPSPQLQVQIPLTPLERFSIMFGDIHGGIHSELLSGRQNITTLDTSIVVEQDKAKRHGVLRRRATSPTSAQFESNITSSVTQNRRSSKYSLFPTTPIPAKPRSETSSPAKSRRRSVTAPSQLRPIPLDMTNTNLSVAQQIQGKSTRSPATVSAALPIPSSTDPYGHKKSSSTNSENEIFFEIKSFRGSSEVEGKHFEMTRPPSSIVQVVRSKSNARKTAQRKMASETVGLQDVAQVQESCELILDTSAQIDETIAIVESLVPPVSGASGAVSPTADTRTIQDVSDHSISHQSQEHAISSIGKGCTATNILYTLPVESMIDLGAKTSLDASFYSSETRHNQRLAPNTQLPPDLSVLPTTVLKPKTSLELICDPPTIGGTTIPLSKYASSQVREELAQQILIRPGASVRVGRSKTENDINCNLVKQHPSQLQKSKRASSLPVIEPAQPSGNTAAMIYAKPAAEVNVARKVSLLRKQSAKIVEPRTNTRVQPSDASRVVQSTAPGQYSREGETKRRAKVDMKLPVVREVHHKLKPGCSIELLRSTAVTGSSGLSPQAQNVNPKLRSGLDKALPPIPVT